MFGNLYTHFNLGLVPRTVGTRRYNFWWLEVLRRSRLDLHRNGTRQQIQWARCRAHFAGRDVQIFCCGGQDSRGEMFNWNTDEYHRMSRHNYNATKYRASSLVQIRCEDYPFAYVQV
jgi:hypothetical protein